MPHPKYKKDITKKELLKTQYTSKVEEFRRHVRIHKNVMVYYKSSKNLFEDLIKVLRKQYNAPNKDFSIVNSKLIINKYSYKIMAYKEGKIIEFETVAKGQLYNIKYKIKKTIFGFVVHYYDYSLAQKTLYGLTSNIAKYYYKKAVRKNTRILRKELRILKKSRKKESK